MGCEELLYLVTPGGGAEAAQPGNGPTAAEGGNFLRQVVPMGLQVIPCDLACGGFAEQRRKESRIILLAYLTLIDQSQRSPGKLRLAEGCQRKKIVIILVNALRVVHGRRELVIKRLIAI